MHRPIDPNGALPTLPILVAKDAENLFEADSPASAAAAATEILLGEPGSGYDDHADVEDEDLALRIRVDAAKRAIMMLALAGEAGVIDVVGACIDPSSYGVTYGGSLTSEELERARQLDARAEEAGTNDILSPEERQLVERYEHQEWMESGVPIRHIEVANDRVFLRSLAECGVIVLAEAPGSYILRKGGPWEGISAPSREQCMFFRPTFQDPELWGGEEYRDWCDQFAIEGCMCEKCPGFAPKGEPRGLPVELPPEEVVDAVPGVDPWPAVVGESVLLNREIRERR
jgi:hypothetical protein